MTILETFIKLRDDIITWVTNNLNQKANISYVDEKFDSITEFDPTEIQEAIDANTAAIDTKYTKPETGIPESDLSVSVQTSLGKANTAIQSLDGYATETYVSNAIDIHDTSDVAHNKIYYSKTEIDDMEFITIADIDSICGASIVAASEVTF